MAEKQIRYGAGGKIYYKDVDSETAEPKKDEVISEILTENPNKEDKPKKKKEKKDEEL
jgi:hypothetical protein|tara:strand:+ start:960 stop:1133 length:174 start_codon:yes stop_codon:yes gene_type:complete